MKRHCLTAYLTLLVIGLLCHSCRTTEREAITPEANPNPWADDYTLVSAMVDYRQWGSYNVHDPSCLKVGDTYYVYSTDAIYREDKDVAAAAGVPLGYIQVRKSNDLVNWAFVGWAFPKIPQEAIQHVRSNSAQGDGATNIWAPYVVKHGEKYRLYYCVSAFAQSVSYMGLAESDSPEGPWELKGCVVKTDASSEMNAIDPSIAVTAEGEHWMVYGSYFGGLFALQLDPETGLALREGDQGHLIARRANGAKDNIEAPEVIYNPEFNQYYLFVSYDPLMTTYNVRVGRSDSPAGPYYDMFGNDMRKETNNYPILTHPYRFANHPGWAGVAHCGVVNDGGRFFMMHQGRLSPGNQMMDLHVRELFWTAEGWPVASPERYAAIPNETFVEADFAGEWEIILIRESAYERGLYAGQILWGEGELQADEVSVSQLYTFTASGEVTGEQSGHWKYADGRLTLQLGDHYYGELMPHMGQDWENEQKTILFTGLDKHGYSLWGKRVK